MLGQINLPDRNAKVLATLSGGQKLERDADLVALLQQQCRRGGGVHSSAHAADDARFLRCNHSWKV